MATLIQPKSESEIRKLGVANVRQAYLNLATDYEKVINNEVLLCPMCNKWQKADTSFYMDKNYATNRFPICKRCLLKMVEQRKNDNDEPHETKESVMKVLQMMDKIYDDAFYEDCIKGAIDDVKEKNRNSPFATYITSINSLPQWRGKTWKDSNFGKQISNEAQQELDSRKPRKDIIKLFGTGFTDEEYLYLQDQYDDWCARTQVDSKSQQTYVCRICFKQLDIWKAQRAGMDTTKLDDSLNKLMDAANLMPKQNVSNAATDSLTFGQLIEKWEENQPIPEPSAEFKDVDGIGKYIRVWFTGWLCKALGLKANVFTKEYDEEITKYTVNKPEATEEGTSDEIYDRLFGIDEGGD